MTITDFIQGQHVHSIVYVVVFLLVIFDAALVVFAAMFLVLQGSLSPVPTAVALVLGVIGEQLLWYWIGHKLKNWSRLMNFLDKAARPFDKHLVGNPRRTLALSKFIYGIHRAMLVRAGMLNINFKRYFYITLYCTFLWLGAIGGLGLAFASSYEALKNYLKYAELIPLGLVIIYFIVDLRLAKRLKKQL